MSPDIIQDADPDIHYDFFSNSPTSQYYSLADYVNLSTKDSLSIISHNIRSYNRNFDSLLTYFFPENMPSIFCLSETRF